MATGGRSSARARGDELDHVVRERHAPRTRHPGFSARTKRVEEWKFFKALDLKRAAARAGEPISEALAKVGAEEAWKTESQQPEHVKVFEQFEATAPSCTSPCRSEVVEDVEIAAVLRLPVMRWLAELLGSKTNRRGLVAARSLICAVFLRLCFSLGRPEVARARKGLLCGRPLENWAHDYPDEGPGRKHFYTSLKKMLRSKPPVAFGHVNIELVKKLADLRDENGELRHPGAGRYGVVDGKLVQADIAQCAAEKGDDGREIPEHRTLLNGPGRESCAFVAYTDDKGRVHTTNAGYRLVVIADLALGVPLVWALVPATAYEPHVALELLDLLFSLWPECGMEFLVGDALHDGSKSYAHRLLFNYGITPVFPQGDRKEYSAKLAHLETDGVPACACGELMIFKDTSNWYGPSRRAKEGIPRGVEAPRLDFRIRYKCRNGICSSKSTMPLDDPRLYSLLPRAGEFKNAYLRRALLLRRNMIESLFASLGHLGLGGRAQERPRWACDRGMEWLLSGGLTYLTARRLVHEAGDYTKAYTEAEELGFLEQPSRANPAPGPGAKELHRAEGRRDLDPPLAPSTWWEVE